MSNTSNSETKNSIVPLVADEFHDDLLPEISFNYDHEELDEEGSSSLELEIENEINSRPRNAGIASCVINLLNTVAGAGMLGLPGAYAGSGFFMGTVLLVIAAFFSGLGLHLLSVSARTAQERLNTRKPASFYTVATAAMPEFAIFIDAAVALKCFGVATGYFVTVGDCMVDSFHYLFRNFSANYETATQKLEEMVFTNRR